MPLGFLMMMAMAMGRGGGGVPRVYRGVRV